MAATEKTTPLRKSQRVQIVVDEVGTRWVIESTGVRRRWYPSTWIRVDFVEERSGGHPYIRAFLSEPFLAAVRGKPNWRSLLNHSQLDKEVCEAYAVIRRVETLVRELCGGDWSRAAIFDVGCGKGFLGTIVAASHPDCAVFMLDKNKWINMEHLNDVPNAEFCLGNVLREQQFLPSFVARKTGPPPRVAILCGIHLCGLLAEKLITTYIHVDCVRGLVLVPCCLCSHKLSQVSEQAKQLSAALDNYTFWSLHLLHMLPRNDANRRTMEEDELMQSIKNRVIVASKSPPRYVESLSAPPAASINTSVE